MGYDYYYIVRNKKGCIEQVHPKQLRKSDYVIHTLSKDEWNEFMLISKVNPLMAKSVDDYLSTYYLYKNRFNQTEKQP